MICEGTALFVAYGGGHVSMVLPVIEALRSRAPGVKCVLLALTTGYRKAVSANAKPVGYKDFLHLVNAQAVRDWGRRLYEENFSPDVSEEESIAYLGINYLDLVEQHGAERAADIYAREGRYGFRPVPFMRRVMDEIKPDVVVATNSPRSERAALDVAIERGIPSIGMIDLFGQETDTYVSHQPRPDITCVISESVKSRLRSQGFDSEHVVVTGSPAFDGLFSTDTQSAAQ